MNIFERGFLKKDAEIPKEEEKIEQESGKKEEKSLEDEVSKKELIQSLMIKKLEAMLDELDKTKNNKFQCGMIGENVLNRKINMVKNFIEKVKSGEFVDLESVSNQVQYARNVNVRYLDEEKTIKTPKRPDKSYTSHVGGVGVDE